MQFSTRRTYFYTLLLFTDFDAGTSTLHLTEIRSLHSIVTRRVSPVAAAYFKLNLVFSTQLFACCLRFSDHWSRQKKPFWGDRWRSIPRFFRPSCFVAKRLKKQRKQARLYSASRGFSLVWLLAFTKTFAWYVCRVVGKPRLTSLANDFVNARRHARENETSAGRVLLGYIWVKGVCSITKVRR